MGFINLSAKNVPWGTRERASEVTYFLGAQRGMGPAAIFYSISPGDVHHPNVVRMAEPHRGTDVFPATVPDEFVQAR